VRLTASPPSRAEFHENLGALTSWNPLDHTGPVTVLTALPLPFYHYTIRFLFQSSQLKFSTHFRLLRSHYGPNYGTALPLYAHD
jgi:hypothetical protein